MNNFRNNGGKMKMILAYILGGLVVLCIAFYAFFSWQQNQLGVTNYEIQSDKINKDIRIVMLSDLHNKQFGENNIDLVNQIVLQKPDLIFIDGDMVDRFDESEDISVVEKLIEQLLDVAPIYYAMGNHETYNQCLKISEDFKEYDNFNFLIDSEADIEVNGQNLSIYGIMQLPLEGLENGDMSIEKCEEFYSRTSFKIMLCHFPEYFEYFFKDKSIDLVLSGHAHGGQIILPWIGGVYAPNQGLFPKYYSGLYETDTAKMIVGRGLGNLLFFPRVNNPPEIVVVDLK